jgi:alpha-N-arabinofuranosidase
MSFTADVSQTVLSTSWHIINLFSNSRYKSTVPVNSDSPFGPAYWVAGTSGEGKYTFKTAIYNATSSVPFNITFAGVAEGTKGSLTVLSAPGGLSANVLDEEGTPTNVVTKTEAKLVAGSGGVFRFELENWEVAVLTT